VRRDGVEVVVEDLLLFDGAFLEHLFACPYGF